jgi:hypothetical protein
MNNCFSEGQIVTTTKVSKGKTQEVPLSSCQEILVPLLAKTMAIDPKIEPIIKVPSYIPAPIKKGDKVGIS